MSIVYCPTKDVSFGFQLNNLLWWNPEPIIISAFLTYVLFPNAHVIRNIIFSQVWKLLPLPCSLVSSLMTTWLAGQGMAIQSNHAQDIYDEDVRIKLGHTTISKWKNDAIVMQSISETDKKFVFTFYFEVGYQWIFCLRKTVFGKWNKILLLQYLFTCMS